MKRIVYLLIVMSLTSAADDSAKETLVLGSYPEIGLYHFNIEQMIIDGIENAGYQVEIQQFPAERSLRSANAGILDGDIARNYMAVKHMPNLIAVPTTLANVSYWPLVIQSKQCPNKTNLSTLKPVGVNGIRYFDHVYSLSNVGFENTKGLPQLLKMLNTKRADYSVMPHFLEGIFQSNYPNQYRICKEQSIFTVDTNLYLHVKHANKLDNIADELAKLVPYADTLYKKPRIQLPRD